MRFHLAVFDLDGTLVDSIRDIHEALTGALRAHGLPTFDIDTTKRLVGDGFHALVVRASGNAYTAELEQRFVSDYLANLTVHSKPYHGIMGMLTASRCLARHMVVLSNKAEAPTKAITSRLGLDPHMDAVYGGDSFDEKKPSPLPVLRIMERFDVSASHTIIIGDNHTDIEAGASAGIHTCFCRYGYGTLSGVRPETEVDSPEEIVHVFRGIR